MFTVLLRKASGAGYYAMAGLPYEPVVQLSTPLSRQSVMEGRTLAIATYNTKLDDDFEILTRTTLPSGPRSRRGMQRGRGAHRGRHVDPYASRAAQMDTDEIVRTDELREPGSRCPGGDVLRSNRSGTGAMKNPRIWSMHDIAALSEPRG